METEKKLAEYLANARFKDLPREPLDLVRNVLMTVLGTAIAGSTAEGVRDVMGLVRRWGGRKEATLLIYGGKVPAQNAAFANSVMARALELCDSMAPGIHIGSSSVPTALAAAELRGGCSGKEFLTALVLGTEVASRINSASVYDGFDPTGVCTVFATAGIAGRILGLDTEQMLNALALAFNKAGGSFQSNIDGSLAVRMIQGFVSQGGILNAELAQRGVSGPRNFLDGSYGYFHLYAKDKHDTQTVVGELGQRFELCKTIFKKHPSCGATQAGTDAILEVIAETGIGPEDVAEVRVSMTPYVYKIVGHQFEIGDNPRVNAQFSMQYCLANALVRRSSRLCHFEESSVRDPVVIELASRVHTQAEAALEDRGVAAVDLEVRTKGGAVCRKSVDLPRGFPGNPLSAEEHMRLFRDCVEYGGSPLPPENLEQAIALVREIEEMRDVRSLIPLLLVRHSLLEC